jgi:hypothetical protein
MRLAEVVFLRFQFQLSGVPGLICGFSGLPGISLLFFHVAQAPLRVSQNDSSGQAVFLG